MAEVPKLIQLLLMSCARLECLDSRGQTSYVIHQGHSLALALVLLILGMLVEENLVHTARVDAHPSHPLHDM